MLRDWGVEAEPRGITHQEKFDDSRNDRDITIMGI
jgi:hypothetical protein